MLGTRKIIEIDEELCTGCGECIIACAEGALALVDGKARLVGDVYCDGLGACIGECPEGALTITERAAEEFDEAAVEQRLGDLKREESAKECEEEPVMACGCPGSMVRTIERKEEAGDGPEKPLRSELCQWPIKIQLLGPSAPFLKNSDLVLLADCVGVSFPELHRKIVKGHSIAIGCPKLDDLDAHVERLAQILKGASIKSLTVAHMEVPCCHGFVWAAEEAMKKAGVDIPMRRIQIGISGEVQREEEVKKPAARAAR